MTSKRFEQVLVPHLKVTGASDRLRPDASLRDLGLDSLHSVELLFDLEDEYDIILADEALVPETFATPQTLYEAVLAAGGTDERA
jgi:acyl carrier protein